jgi:integrase/recombinase XerD
MKARALLEPELLSIRFHLLNGYRKPTKERELALFELGVNAGPRISELVGLNVGQVLQYGEVVDVLEFYITKGNRHRRVPLNRWVRSVLSAFVAWKEQRGESLESKAPLFCNLRGGRLTRQGADLILKGIFRECRLAGKVTTHSLRKTFATQLSSKGVPIRVIQELLGHRNLNTTEAYVAVTEQDKLRAVEALVPELDEMSISSSSN